jgi:hypothetical protein
VKKVHKIMSIAVLIFPKVQMKRNNKKKKIGLSKNNFPHFLLLIVFLISKNKFPYFQK